MERKVKRGYPPDVGRRKTQMSWSEVRVSRGPGAPKQFKFKNRSSMNSPLTDVSTIFSASDRGLQDDPIEESSSIHLTSTTTTSRP